MRAPATRLLWELGLLRLAAACGSSPAAPPMPGTVGVTLTSPSPGDELLASDHPTITVAGTVTATSPGFGGLTTCVDGAPGTLDASGAFTIEVTPTVGINHVDVEAGDGDGNFASQQLDVMWAPDYVAPVATTAGFQLPDALDLNLTQAFFDQRQLGTTLDLTTNPVVAHDLASALELILWNIDLASLIGGGIQVGSGNASLNITIPSATPAEIIVDAQIVDGPTPAIGLDIDLDGVFLATSGTFHEGTTSLVVAGGISADMHAHAELDVAVQPDGTIAVTVTNVTATVGPLTPSFTGANGDELDGFITIGNSDFRTLVSNLIQQQLIPTFTNELPPLLESLLGATDKLLDNVSFTLDAKLGGTPVTVTLNGNVGSLDVVSGPAVGEAPGHITVHQQVAITTGSAPIHGSSRGAGRVSAMPVLPPSNTASLQVLLSQDFLNGLLHALWNSGLLEGSAMFGGLQANVSAKLSPFVVPTPDTSSCEIDGVRCDVVVQLGQLEVALPDFSQSFAINATAGGRVEVNGTTVSIVIQQTPTLVVWETSAMPGGRLTPDAIKDVVANVVWPQLFGAIGNDLHITLPIPDLAALGLDALSPNLANAQLQLDVGQQAAVTDGYVGLGANLELATPPPP